MTAKEAYRNIFNDECSFMCCVPEGEPCMDNCQWRAVLGALKKQIPMRVKEIHVDEYYCPACGGENNCDQGLVRDRYCPLCGQSLLTNTCKDCKHFIGCGQNMKRASGSRQY